MVVLRKSDTSVALLSSSSSSSSSPSFLYVNSRAAAWGIRPMDRSFSLCRFFFSFLLLFLLMHSCPSFSGVSLGSVLGSPTWAAPPLPDCGGSEVFLFLLLLLLFCSSWSGLISSALSCSVGNMIVHTRLVIFNTTHWTLYFCNAVVLQGQTHGFFTCGKFERHTDTRGLGLSNVQ